MARATAENGWVSTEGADDPEVLARAQAIMETTRYACLSTCSADGWPWASPLFFAYDTAWTIYWSSAMAAQHSQNLAHNQGQSAIAVYSTQHPQGSVQGLFFQGVAQVLAPDRVTEVLPLLQQRMNPPAPRTAADYLPPSPRRIYQFQPQTVWITGERLTFGTVVVDTKLQLRLTDLTG